MLADKLIAGIQIKPNLPSTQPQASYAKCHDEMRMESRNQDAEIISLSVLKYFPCDCILLLCFLIITLLVLSYYLTH